MDNLIKSSLNNIKNFYQKNIQPAITNTYNNFVAPTVFHTPTPQQAQGFKPVQQAITYGQQKIQNFGQANPQAAQNIMNTTQNISTGINRNIVQPAYKWFTTPGTNPLYDSYKATSRNIEVPQIDLAKNIKNPYLRIGAEIVQGIPNLPYQGIKLAGEMNRGIVEGAGNIYKTLQGEKVPVQSFVRNAADIAALPVNVALMNEGAGDIIKSNTLKRKILSSIGEGWKFGSTTGGIEALQNIKNTDNFSTVATNVIKEGVQKGLTMAAISTLFGGLSFGWDRVRGRAIIPDELNGKTVQEALSYLGQANRKGALSLKGPFVIQKLDPQGNIMGDTGKTYGWSHDARNAINSLIKEDNVQYRIIHKNEGYMVPARQEAYSGIKVPAKEQAAKKLPGIMYEKKPLPNYLYTKEGADQAAGTAQARSTEPGLFDKILAKLVGEHQSAGTKAVQVSSKFADIPKELGPKIIKSMENPMGRVSPQVKGYVGKLRQEYDRLFKDAKTSGIDINYLKDYVTHIWDRPQGQVQQNYKVFKQRFGYTNNRTIPTYEEGLRMGLIPKFNHPAEILNNYVAKLEQVKANLSAFKEMKANGLIVPARVGYGRPGFVAIDAPGFPKSVSMDSSKRMFQGNWYAPQEVAQKLNSLFAPQGENVLLKAAGNLSSKIQDITLSGGIPGTPINAFTAAQATKEFLSGRVVSPIKSMIRAISEGKTNEFLSSNASQIIKMQERNVPINTSLTIDSLMGGGTAQKTFLGKVGGVWSKIVNEPTFKRFMPMLQINLFNDIEKQALKQGMGQKEAADVAAKAVKNFYGLTGTEKTVFRSKDVNNLLSTVFFAPHYRESMINFWINNLKSMKNPLAPENLTNAKFIVGAVGTYLGMNYLNNKLNGHNMAENPKGTEDQLLIPVGNGHTIGIPFLSSIATVPRSLMKAGVHLAQGDLKQTGVDLRSNLSMAIKPFADVGANQNYFGEEIYSENDTRGERIKKIGIHLAKSYQHPYIQALIGRTQKGEGPAITVSKALELPFRFYTTDKLDKRVYFDQKDQALKGLTADDKALYDKLHNGGAVDEDGLPIYDKRSEMANALDRLSNPNVLRAEAQTAIATSQKTGQPLNPLYQLDPKQQETVLILKTFYPGDKNKSTITQVNISWLKPYWQQRDQYVAYLKQQGVVKDNPNYPIAPKPNEILQKKLDLYNTLPSGTGIRSAFIRANPDILNYFNSSRDFTNSQRADLGLPLLENPYQSSSGGAKKPKKIAIKKGKSGGTSKFKVGTKIKKIKTISKKKFKVVASKQPKIKVKIPKV